MPLAAFDLSSADDDVQRQFSRLSELLGEDAVPKSFQAYGRQPAFLKDLLMNLKKFVVGEGQLEDQLRAKIGLATALHAKNADWTNLMAARVRATGGDDATVTDVLAIASTNYMYNTFFKFRTLAGGNRFEAHPVGLRAHTFAGTSLPDREVELINIAISDLNACQPCVSGHVEKAKQLELKDEQILEAIQVAAVVYAGAMYLNSASIL